MKNSQEPSRKVHRAITELFIRRGNLASSKARKYMSNRENNVLIKDKKDTMSPFKLCVKESTKKGAL